MLLRTLIAAHEQDAQETNRQHQALEDRFNVVESERLAQIAEMKQQLADENALRVRTAGEFEHKTKQLREWISTKISHFEQRSISEAQLLAASQQEATKALAGAPHNLVTSVAARCTYEAVDLRALTDERDRLSASLRTQEARVAELEALRGSASAPKAPTGLPLPPALLRAASTAALPPALTKPPAAIAPTNMSTIHQLTADVNILRHERDMLKDELKKAKEQIGWQAEEIEQLRTALLTVPTDGGEPPASVGAHLPSSGSGSSVLDSNGSAVDRPIKKGAHMVRPSSTSVMVHPAAKKKDKKASRASKTVSVYNVNMARQPVLERSGYLYKQGGSVKSWKKRFFVLKNSSLYYYKTEEDSRESEALGCISLRGMVKVSNGVQMDTDPKPNMISITTLTRVYYLSASKEEIMNEWYDAISDSIKLASVSPSVVQTAKEDGSLVQGWLVKHKRGLSNSRWAVLKPRELLFFKTAIVRSPMPKSCRL